MWPNGTLGRSRFTTFGTFITGLWCLIRPEIQPLEGMSIDTESVL